MNSLVQIRKEVDNRVTSWSEFYGILVNEDQIEDLAKELTEIIGQLNWNIPETTEEDDEHYNQMW